MYVANELEHIPTVLDEDRSESALEEMPTPLMLPVVDHGETDQHRPYESGKGLLAASDQEMQVIGHQRPGQDRMAVFRVALLYAGEHHSRRFQVDEGGTTVDGAAHDVMRASRSIEPRLVSHASIVVHSEPKCKGYPPNMTCEWDDPGSELPV